MKDLVLGACPLVAGLLVAATTPMDTAWYNTLPKPSWTPPSWVFGPVWTVLYILMGVAAVRVVGKTPGGIWSWPMLLFWIQLALNVAWTPVFFGQKRPDTALKIMWWLCVTAAATTYLFWTVDHTAGALLLPYVLWLSVASALNVAVVHS